MLLRLAVSGQRTISSGAITRAKVWLPIVVRFFEMDLPEHSEKFVEKAHDCTRNTEIRSECFHAAGFAVSILHKTSIRRPSTADAERLSASGSEFWPVIV